MSRLLDLLRRDAFRRGEFVLSSGKTSDFFIDCKPVVLSAEGHALVGSALHTAIRHADPDVSVVAGVALGGCSLASAVATVSWYAEDPLDAIYIRKTSKSHGTGRRIEGAERLATGARVAIVEDTVTTGGSTLRALEELRKQGYVVETVVAIVDRCEGGRAAIEGAGVSFVSLFDRNDFMGAD